MRTIKSKGGINGVRLWFTLDEIEATMGGLRVRSGQDQLRRGGVDVERVLKSEFGIEADYQDLGDGVLGATHFAESGELAVVISAQLGEEAEVDTVAWRRLRSTLAHECGHCALHRTLFQMNRDQTTMFESVDAIDKHLCRSADICPEMEHSGAHEFSKSWTEYQANQAMSQLLLPREWVLEFMEQLEGYDSHNGLGTIIAVKGVNYVIERVAEAFDVSKQMVHYRLSSLGLSSSTRLLQDND